VSLVRGATLIVFLLFVPGCLGQFRPLTPVVGRPLVLAVVTWNMGAGRGDLPRLLTDVSSGRLTGVAVPNVLVLLQEATESGILEATSSRGAPLPVFFVPVRQGAIRTTGNAIVASMRLADTRVIDLPRERQLRTAAAATVLVGGQRLFVVSAHLENRLGWLRGLFGDHARRRQVDALLAALPRNGHGIIGGDLNTMLGPAEPALTVLRERFTDTPRSASPPTFGGRLVLDHLFFDLPDGWVASRRVLEDSYGSDHQPVLAVVAR
jgi:endonuclease/exonuclease/phosphatase family metal-dependent hydrolase